MNRNWKYYLDNFDGTYDLDERRIFKSYQDGSIIDTAKHTILVRREKIDYGGWDRAETVYHGFVDWLPRPVITLYETEGQRPPGTFHPWQETLPLDWDN